MVALFICYFCGSFFWLVFFPSIASPHWFTILIVFPYRFFYLVVSLSIGSSVWLLLPTNSCLKWFFCSDGFSLWQVDLVYFRD
jgi:hypothetical protein